MPRPRNLVILLGAGVGRRLGAECPKAFLEIGGRPMIAVAAAAAAASPTVDTLIVAVPEGWEQAAERELAELGKPVIVTRGNSTRHGSVRAALAKLLAGAEAADRIACHDAARPFAPPDLFTAVFAALGDGDVEGAIPVLPIPDTVKRVRAGLVVDTEPRDELGLAQTPQAFLAEPFLNAHDSAAAQGVEFSDDAAVLDRAGYRVRAIPGDPGNFKITTLGDLARARARMTGGESG